METLKNLKLITYMVIPPIFTFTGLNKDIVLILGIFILVDIITGVIRELVVNGGRFTSRTLWVNIASKGLLILIPLMLSLVGKGIGMDLLWISQLSLSALILAEFYSTLGNLVQIRKNDKTLDEQDAVTIIIKSIESFIKDMLKTIIKKFNVTK